MMNYDERETEKILKQLEGEISKLFGDASKEVEKKWNNYLNGWNEVVEGKLVHHMGLQERIDKEYLAYLEGKYTDSQWNAWMMSQVGRGDRWDALRSELADKMANASQMASSYINDATPGIFSLCSNYSAYEIESATGISFTAYSEVAVQRLFLGSDLLPLSRVNGESAVKWNSRELQNALISGIIQGKNIRDIATDFQRVCEMDRTCAIRNARTSFTSAMNGGRQESMERASKMGIEIKKQWVATIDDRTRDSHAELDGITIEYDERFPNGLLFPGDKDGNPAEVYNCRCAMRKIFPKYMESERDSKIPGHEGQHSNETYHEWLKRKEEEQKNMRPTTHADATFRAMENKDGN